MKALRLSFVRAASALLALLSGSSEETVKGPSSPARVVLVPGSTDGLGQERVLTENGNELPFQVNYLAGYLLTRELLPLLRESGPEGGGRGVLAISSEAESAFGTSGVQWV